MSMNWQPPRKSIVIVYTPEDVTGDDMAQHAEANYVPDRNAGIGLAGAVAVGFLMWCGVLWAIRKVLRFL